MKKKAQIVGLQMTIQKRFLGKKIHKPQDYEKLNDIVEVWFDSGSTHSLCS